MLIFFEQKKEREKNKGEKEKTLSPVDSPLQVGSLEGLDLCHGLHHGNLAPDGEQPEQLLQVLL